MLHFSKNHGLLTRKISASSRGERTTEIHASTRWTAGIGDDGCDVSSLATILVAFSFSYGSGFVFVFCAQWIFDDPRFTEREKHDAYACHFEKIPLASIAANLSAVLYGIGHRGNFRDQGNHTRAAVVVVECPKFPHIAPWVLAARGVAFLDFGCGATILFLLAAGDTVDTTPCITDCVSGACADVATGPSYGRFRRLAVDGSRSLELA